MMSQNRQSAHDRLDAQHDYEVNLKAEMEIVALHTKLDEILQQKWLTLMLPPCPSRWVAEPSGPPRSRADPDRP